MKKIDKNLKEDITNIECKLESDGIVFESEYDSLTSKFCKEYALDISDYLSDITKLNIFYSYGNRDSEHFEPYFAFYDQGKFESSEEVSELINKVMYWLENNSKEISDYYKEWNKMGRP